MSFKCNKCLKEISFGIEVFYNLIGYHEEVIRPIGKDKNWIVCQPCYQANELEYLQNYRIIAKNPPGNNNYYIKWGDINCYVGKKDQNGQILKQKDCRHCQPWKYINANDKWKCANCAKLITVEDTRYFGNDGKILCSVSCVDIHNNKNKEPQQQNLPKSPNNNQNERIATGLKVFVWIVGIVITLILILLGGKIICKKKKKNIIIYDHKQNE